MNKIKVIVILLMLFCTACALASDRRIIRHYSNDGSRTGYSVIENGRESRFDKNWNRKGGYSIHSENRVERFGNEANRMGHDYFDNDNNEERED